MNMESFKGVETCGFNGDLWGKGPPKQGLGQRATAMVSLAEDED